MPTLLHNRSVARPAATLPPLVITTASLPNTSNGSAYSTPLAATGGAPPYIWSLLSAVPNTANWLSISAIGVLSGTAHGPETETVLAQVQDSQGTKASAFFTIAVSGVALSITSPGVLPGATVGTSYSYAMAATGGVAPYTWSVLTDTPDTGNWLTISTGGLLSGVPGTAEIESLTIQVRDSLGNTASAPFSITVTSNVFSPNFPRTSFHGTGGTVTDLFWNNPTVTVMRLGSIPILTAYGKYGVFTFGEDYEGFAHDFNATLTTLKASSTTDLGTRVGKYGMAEETFTPTSDPTNYPGYKTWADVVMSPAFVSTGSNFLAYTNHTSGSPVNAPDGSARFLVNMAENSSGVPYAGFTVNIGQTWTPSQWAAFYQFYKTLNKARTGPIAGLFTNCNVLGASPLFDFVDMDNIFVYFGVQADIFRNGVLSPSANELTYTGAYSDALAYGQARMFNQFKLLIAAAGGSQWTSGNSGAYARIDLGNTQATAGAMWQVQNSGFWETVIGKPNALEWQLTFPTLLACYQHYLDFLGQPKVLRINLVIPNGTGANLPPYNSTPTAVNGLYQYGRYLLAFAALNNGFAGIQLQTSAYNLNGSDLVWLDEFDNAAAQMNWLGQAVDPPQTSVYVWADGSTIPNVYARRFANGIAICIGTTGTGSSAQPSGTITITGAQLGISTQPLKRINGTQAPAVNSGAAITSAGVTLQASRDGIFLVYTSTDGATISGGVLTVRRAAGGFGTKATAAPLYFNDFEGQSVGDSYLTCGLNNINNDGTPCVVANDRAFNGSKSLKVVYPAFANANSAALFPGVGKTIPNSQAVYSFCKMYWTLTQGSSNGPIFKLARCGAGVPYHGTPQRYKTIRPNGSLIDSGGDSGCVTPVKGTSYSQVTFGTVVSPINANVWNTLESKDKLATPGGTDGVAQDIVNGKDNFAGKFYNGSGTLLTGAAGYCSNNDSGSTASYQWAISAFDGLDTYGANNAYAVWVDCLYYDTTLQCCVMTDNAVYTSSSRDKIMIQIPTAWSDTQATFTYRNDGFTVGQTAWIHIFNANGVEVAAYQVTVQ